MKNLALILLLASPAFGVTRYISPSGSDANSCAASVTITTPKLTFTSAIACMAAGDTLILRDGTYASGTTGFISLSSKNGTAALPFTFQAENERAALISGTGLVATINITSSSYIVFHGLRLRGADNSTAGGFGSTIGILNSHHLTLRRCLITHNNRYKNTHLVEVTGMNDSLFEENEFYLWHRHAINMNSSARNTIRRCYFNSRAYADIGGGYPSSQSSKGDSSMTLYPASDCILENNISEGSSAFASINADAPADNNQFLGNVSLSDDYGIKPTARGSTNSQMAHNNLIKNHVAINPTYAGVYSRSSKTTQVQSSSFIAGLNSQLDGVLADAEPGALGDGNYSISILNSLAKGFSSGTGFDLNTSLGSWTFAMNYPDSFGNGTAFNPVASNPNITNELTTDPSLGSCYLWIPSTSPMKGAGLGGVDIGANVLYQYQNGVLTSTPLWNTSTNNFTGCGAIVAGVNDVAGSSCTDAEVRLHVGVANGCAYPSGYGSAGSPGGTWLPTDNFDSYTLGNSLSGGAGGTGWTGNWTEAVAAVTVQSAPAGGQGGGAAFVNGDPDFSYTRTFADLSAGIGRVSFRMNTTSPADAIYISLDEGTTGRCMTVIGMDGFYKIWDGTTQFTVAPYTANTWHSVDIEFDNAAQPNKCRARLNNGNFSQWFPAANGGTYSVINRLRIKPEGNGLFASQFYWDDIQQGSTSVVTSTIDLIDSGLGGNLFTGEVKRLDWSTVDYTGNVDLKVSRDNGATFQMLAQGVSNTCAAGGLNGCYNWTVDGPASAQTKVQTCLSSNPTICDTSLAFAVYGTYLKVR